MSYETIDPRRAFELMHGSTPYTYLDVRSVEEFNAGHAEGALNVPIAHLGAGGMAPNPDFVTVVSAHVDKEAPLVVGCKMGGRSARACEMLAAAGYTNLKNIDGGFGGRPGAGDESVEAGWQGAGLPVSTTAPQAATYEYLKSKA